MKVSLLPLFAVVPDWFNTINEEYQNNEQLQKLIKAAVQNELRHEWMYKGGVFLFRNKNYLPDKSTLLLVIIGEKHSSSREGFEKTWTRIRQVFYWIGMTKSVKQFIKSCVIC